MDVVTAGLSIGAVNRGKPLGRWLETVGPGGNCGEIWRDDLKINIPMTNKVPGDDDKLGPTRCYSEENKLIGYVTLGTNDFAKAAVFYDQVLGVIGARRVWEMSRFINWGNAKGSPMLGIVKPYDGQAASVGNGTMVALDVGSNEKVEEVYQKALAVGGKDEGEPGNRTERFYGAYFRDLDGNKLCVYHLS